MNRCPECQGAGELRRVRQSILGQVITAVPCHRCQGTGQSIESPCTDCRGEGRRNESRTLTVDIPAGVDDGSTLRLAGHGPAGFRGGPNGALFVHLSVGPDDVFQRSGVDLHATVHVPMALAALGGSIPFDTLDDARDLSIAVGTQSGAVLTLKGLGVPKLRGRGRGELYVHLQVDTPTDLDDDQRELLVRWPRPGPRRWARPRSRGPLLQAALRAELTVAGSAGTGGRPPGAPRPPTRCWWPPRPWSSWPIPRPPWSRTPTSVTCSTCCGSGPASWWRCPTAPGGGRRAGWPPTPRPRGPAGPTRPALLVPDGPVVVTGRPVPEVTVAFAPTKGDRPEWVAQKLTELGVDRVVPLRTSRSVVRWEGERGAKAVERLRRVAREAAAQCRRAWLPEVSGVCRLDEVAGRRPARPVPWPTPAARAPGLDRPVAGHRSRGRVGRRRACRRSVPRSGSVPPSCGPRRRPWWPGHSCAGSGAVWFYPLRNHAP